MTLCAGLGLEAAAGRASKESIHTASAAGPGPKTVTTDAAETSEGPQSGRLTLSGAKGGLHQDKSHTGSPDGEEGGRAWRTRTGGGRRVTVQTGA